MAKDKTKKDPTKRPNIAILVLVLFCAIIALPTTILLCVGGLPSIVALLVDKTKLKARALSVTAINLAACSLYLFKLWSHGNDFYYALSLIIDPVAIIVMYSGAAAGYCIDWVMSGAISQMLYMKAQARQKEIVARQKALVKRWGVQVTGRKTETAAGQEDKNQENHDETAAANNEDATQGAAGTKPLTGTAARHSDEKTGTAPDATAQKPA